MRMRSLVAIGLVSCSLSANARADGVSPPPLAPPLYPAAQTPPTLVAVDGYPLAGRLGEYFHLRDSHDDFRLYFSGRVHVDAYAPFGPASAPRRSGAGSFRRSSCGEPARSWRASFSGDGSGWWRASGGARP